MQCEYTETDFAHPLPLTCEVRNLVLSFAKDRHCNYFSSLQPPFAMTHRLAKVLLNTQIFLE